MNRRERARRLGDIQRVMGALRQSDNVPDMTDSILSRVHEQREFLPPATRRWVGRLRLVAAGCAALSALAVACAWRWAPQATTVVARPTPVSNVLCVGCRAAESVQRLADTFDRASDTQPADFLLALTADAPAVNDPRECAGRVASLPCPVPPCIASRQGLSLPSEIILVASTPDLLSIGDAAADSAVEVASGVWSLLHEDPGLALAAMTPAVSGSSADAASFGRAPKPLAESLAPILWGRPLRGSGIMGSGLPK